MRLRRSDLSWQELDGEIIVLDLAGSEYLKLNGTAALLWRLLDDGADEDRLVTELVDSYDLDEARAREDVATFLAELDGAQLLEREA